MIGEDKQGKANGSALFSGLNVWLMRALIAALTVIFGYWAQVVRDSASILSTEMADIHNEQRAAETRRLQMVVDMERRLVALEQREASEQRELDRVIAELDRIKAAHEKWR